MTDDPVSKRSTEENLILTERVYLFVDGANLFYSAKELGIRIDYAKLKKSLAENRRLIRAYFYAASPTTPKERKFHEKLQYLGYVVRTTQLRKYGEMTSFEKGVDVMLATDMLNYAHLNVYDVAILVAGDSDYAYAVKSLKDIGKRIEIASFDHSFSGEMKRIADRTISLSKMIARIKIPSFEESMPRAQPSTDAIGARTTDENNSSESRSNLKPFGGGD